METVKLVVHKRDKSGKGVARRLRRAGQLPAVVYGNGSTLAIALAEKDLAKIRQSEAGENTILVDPKPLFDISPQLYMQFMEPLGITDSSVEAAWDYEADDWRKDFVDVVKDLSPNVMRFGGLYSRYYRWREGIGPAAKRWAARRPPHAE